MSDSDRTERTTKGSRGSGHAGIGTLWDTGSAKPELDGEGHQDKGGIRDAADEFLEQPGTVLDPIPEPDDRDR